MLAFLLKKLITYAQYKDFLTPLFVFLLAIRLPSAHSKWSVNTSTPDELRKQVTNQVNVNEGEREREKQIETKPKSPFACKLDKCQNAPSMDVAKQLQRAMNKFERGCKHQN